MLQFAPTRSGLFFIKDGFNSPQECIVIMFFFYHWGQFFDPFYLALSYFIWLWVQGGECTVTESTGQIWLVHAVYIHTASTILDQGPSADVACRVTLCSIRGFFSSFHNEVENFDHRRRKCTTSEHCTSCLKSFIQKTDECFSGIQTNV